MSRFKDFDATGIAPNGRLYAGDLDGIQDLKADRYNLAENLGAASLAVAEAGLILSRYGAGEARISGALRTDGILRGLGGFIPGAFTTIARDAIGANLAPKGIGIYNSDLEAWQYNAGTDVARSWRTFGGAATLDYQPRTTDLTINYNTAEAGATTFLTSAGIAVDGATLLKLEFFAPMVDSNANAGGTTNILLVRNGVTRCLIASPITSHFVKWEMYETPLVGTYVYAVKAHNNATTGSTTYLLHAGTGTGGSASYAPMFFRVSAVRP